MSLPARDIAIDQPASEPVRGPIEHAKTMPSFDYRAMMLDVMRKHSKSYFAQLREMYELKLGPGRIAPVEELRRLGENIWRHGAREIELEIW